MFGHGCFLSFRGNLFVTYTLSNMIVLWHKLFIHKCFSKNGMAMRNLKKNLRKQNWERTSGTTKWDKLGQVGVRGTSGTRRRGSSDLRGASGTRTRGLSTWTIPFVPNGTTRPWNSPKCSSTVLFSSASSHQKLPGDGFLTPVPLCSSIGTIILNKTDY